MYAPGGDPSITPKSIEISSGRKRRRVPAPAPRRKGLLPGQCQPNAYLSPSFCADFFVVFSTLSQ
jgi:hypothetical protein